MTKVARQISFYDKYNDKYVGEIPLGNVDLKDLLVLIKSDDYKKDPLLYNCYLLDKSILDKLSVLAKQTFFTDFDKYEYYLEATAQIN